jgi:hypothetical protein
MRRRAVLLVVLAALEAAEVYAAPGRLYLPIAMQRPSPTATRPPTRTPYWLDTATPTLTPAWTPMPSPPPPTAPPTRQPGPLHLRGQNVIEAFRQNGLAVVGVTSE